MKKILFALLILVVLLAAVSCDKGNNAPEKTDGTPMIPVTEEKSVPVTDASGNTVTDEGGATVTTVVTVPVTDPSGNPVTTPLQNGGADTDAGWGKLVPITPVN